MTKNNLKIVKSAKNQEAEAKEKVDETEFLGKIVASLEISEESAESIIELGLRNFDDIAYASKKKLSNIFENEEEIQRVKSAAEDAALLEAMSEVEQDEQDQESLTDLFPKTDQVLIGLIQQQQNL